MHALSSNKLDKIMHFHSIKNKPKQIVREIKVHKSIQKENPYMIKDSKTVLIRDVLNLTNVDVLYSAHSAQGICLFPFP